MIQNYMKRFTHYDDENKNSIMMAKDGSYQKSKMCNYCEEYYFTEELTKKLTLKMIIQMDKHLFHRGKNYDWLNRSDYKFLDISNLYETHDVCKTCYKLYEEITELLNTYQEFSKYIGVNMELDKSGQLVSITS